MAIAKPAMAIDLQGFIYGKEGITIWKGSRIKITLFNNMGQVVMSSDKFTVTEVYIIAHGGSAIYVKIGWSEEEKYSGGVMTHSEEIELKLYPGMEFPPKIEIIPDVGDD